MWVYIFYIILIDRFQENFFDFISSFQKNKKLQLITNELKWKYKVILKTFRLRFNFLKMYQFTFAILVNLRLSINWYVTVDARL